MFSSLLTRSAMSGWGKNEQTDRQTNGHIKGLRAHPYLRLGIQDFVTLFLFVTLFSLSSHRRHPSLFLPSEGTTGKRHRASHKMDGVAKRKHAGAAVGDKSRCKPRSQAAVEPASSGAVRALVTCVLTNGPFAVSAAHMSAKRARTSCSMTRTP